MDEINITEKTKLLVTGGSGLVGQALQRVLKNNENFNSKINKLDRIVFLSSKDVDLTDELKTREIFHHYQPKYVIHLAAHVGGLYSNMNDNLNFYRINSRINDNVLACAFSTPLTQECISCLSTCIFPDHIAQSGNPIDESQLHLGPPHDSNFGYSYAKRMIDVLNRAYRQKCQIMNLNKNFKSVIPTNIYGINDNFDIKNGHVIPALIHKTYLSVERALYLDNRSGDKFVEAKVKVFGSGRPRRQFIYADDLAKLILWYLDNNDTYGDQSIILSVDESDEMSIGEAALMIATAFENRYKNQRVKIDMEYDTSFEDGQIRKNASNKKLRSVLPDFKFTPFIEGVQKTVDWFCDNYSVARK